MGRATMPERDALLVLDDDPLWYQNAVIYQVHVKSFFDSDGDGIGDFRGLSEKLDYLQDLGVTALWVMPFYPSPLRDDGYDIADYTGVNPSYGTMADVKRFVDEAHRRGLRVITELVINHTSDQHPWFQRSRHAKPGSKWRDFYVWSDTPDKYADARIIFKDFEPSNWSWDPVAGAYYWHRFYHHQPDLNFDNPAVHDAVLKALDFWMDLGVDGLRLDAIPYLYEREGTTGENLPETHAFLKKLRAHMDAKYSNRMVLAEANQWPEDTREYFGDGDECHMAFNFPVMPRMYMAVQLEDRYPIIDILQQTPEIPANAQWALFLRNHDELTLEMVTDEERDYMYRAYAADPRARINLGIRRRLAPLLNNNRRKIELLHGLLFSLPGTPVLYYGDEIGMGDNIYLGDRDGVRTPMQWTADRNAGFSKANPQKLFLPVNIDPEYRYESINVASQQNNPTSLLWWMRRLITLRQRHPVFGRGDITFLHPDNPKVLAFVRSSGDETVLVVANLSRYVQYAELDMAEFQGRTPVELFGKTPFPTIGELPYFLTLGPHSFYWLKLEPRPEEVTPAGEEGPDVPSVTLSGSWDTLFTQTRARGAFEAALPEVLVHRRWYGAKARTIQTVTVLDAVPLPRKGRSDLAYLVLVQVAYTDGEPSTYVLPLAFATGDAVDAVLHDIPAAAVLRVRPRGQHGADGLVYDATYDSTVDTRLLEAIGRRQKHRGSAGVVQGVTTSVYRSLRGDDELTPSVARGEQSNTSVLYGDRLILKVFRRASRGLNPDWELGRFLTERVKFPHVPAMAGALTYTDVDGQQRTLAVLQELVAHEDDAWSYTLSHLGGYYEDVQQEFADEPGLLTDTRPPNSLVDLEVPDPAQDLFGAYLQQAALLGERTAQMHLALASARDLPDLAPEAFTPHYQRSIYQSSRNQFRQMLSLLRRRRGTLAGAAAEDADRLLASEDALYAAIEAVKGERIGALRIRVHGDYHLGQVLFTGRDFMIIDFEGEPAKSLSQRRIKRSPLRDVAGMLRSFHYAAYTGLSEHVVQNNVQDEAEVMPTLVGAARFWTSWVSASFLTSYLGTAGPTLLPEGQEASEVLLRSFLLEKAAYEVAYELNNRPAWVGVPLRGMLHLLE
ncbi:MAG: maltose alpha-D-glucosyltransferase [Candidatus Nanopelagicales bacterium]